MTKPIELIISHTFIVYEGEQYAAEFSNCLEDAISGVVQAWGVAHIRNELTDREWDAHQNADVARSTPEPAEDEDHEHR